MNVSTDHVVSNSAERRYRSPSGRDALVTSGTPSGRSVLATPSPASVRPVLKSDSIQDYGLFEGRRSRRISKRVTRRPSLSTGAPRLACLRSLPIAQSLGLLRKYVFYSWMLSAVVQCSQCSSRCDWAELEQQPSVRGHRATFGEVPQCSAFARHIVCLMCMICSMLRQRIRHEMYTTRRCFRCSSAQRHAALGVSFDVLVGRVTAPIVVVARRCVTQVFISLHCLSLHSHPMPRSHVSNCRGPAIRQILRAPGSPVMPKRERSVAGFESIYICQVLWPSTDVSAATDGGFVTSQAGIATVAPIAHVVLSRLRRRALTSTSARNSLRFIPQP